MLIIGHYGSAEKNSTRMISSISDAITAEVDMIEAEVRLTSDGMPIVSHSFSTHRARRVPDAVARHSLAELRKKPAAGQHPVVTLEAALKEMLGKMIIIIDIKEYRAVTPVLRALKPFMKREEDWEMVMFSSFNPLILRKIRMRAPHAALALLHHRNPLNFIAWQIPLRLTAVGFHRLHLSTFGLKVAQKLGLFTYVYTVNRLGAAKILEEKGYDGVVTDYPAQFVKDLQKS